jgi:hypothetical protein
LKINTLKIHIIILEKSIMTNIDKKELWDSDTENSDVHDTFPNNSVILGRNTALVKNNEEHILQTDSFREYLEQIRDFEDLRAIFISMILDVKERVRGCEYCETCSQVIELVDMNISMCKKISKLAHGFANVFMYLVKGAIPDKLNENQKNLLNVAFILLVKNSKFFDIQYIREKFKAFINVDAFEGLALRLAIQKFRSADIRIMLQDWGCNPIICNHRPIIRAFYYEKFGIIRTLIERGSCYKYYLQEELSPNEYQIFQKAIDKYLATKLPEATEIEKEFHIVGMINDYRHMLLEDDNEDGHGNNPLSNDCFLEEFIQYFYEITDINQSSDKKKKKKKRRNKKKAIQANAIQADNAIQANAIQANATQADNALDIANDTVITNEGESNEYDLLNDETFNLEPINEPNESVKETILLDSYYTDKPTAKISCNQIHLENWKLSYKQETSNYWDNHFWNAFRLQYSY